MPGVADDVRRPPLEPVGINNVKISQETRADDDQELTCGPWKVIGLPRGLVERVGLWIVVPAARRGWRIQIGTLSTRGS